MPSEKITICQAPAQHFTGIDRPSAFRHRQQNQRTAGSDQTYRHTERLQGEETHQQQRQYRPAGSESRTIANRILGIGKRVNA